MTLKIDGLKINFNTFGEGQTLILLHGWGCDTKIWGPLIPHLVPWAKVVTLDLPGFGESDLPKKTWSLANYAQLLKKVIKELHLTNPILLGHSFGGGVTIKFTACYPKLLHKLILVGSTGIKPKREIYRWFLFGAAKIGKLPFKVPPFNFFLENCRHLFYHLIKRTDYLNAGRLKNTFLSVIKEDLTPLLSKISVPTLIVWGQKDREVPLKFAQTMYSKIPQAKLRIFENCGHFLFLEKPKDFAKVVKDFINSNG